MAVPFTLLPQACFLDVSRLAVYLQQDPAALSQGSPGVSPRPSLDEQGRPSCRGQRLWATQRGKAQCSRRLMGMWPFLCARHSAGPPDRKGDLISSCVGASLYRLNGLRTTARLDLELKPADPHVRGGKGKQELALEPSQMNTSYQQCSAQRSGKTDRYWGPRVRKNR